MDLAGQIHDVAQVGLMVGTVAALGASAIAGILLLAVIEYARRDGMA